MDYNYALTIWVYLQFIGLAVFASHNREITRNSDKIWPYRSSRSSKVIDLSYSHPCLTPPLRGNLLEFLDETYPAKTRRMVAMALQYGENFMILSLTVFVW